MDVHLSSKALNDLTRVAPFTVQYFIHFIHSFLGGTEIVSPEVEMQRFPYEIPVKVMFHIQFN